MIDRLSILLLALFTQACISTAPPPKTFYYLLEERALTYSWEEEATEVQVRIATMPSYLKQPSLVMLEQNHQLSYANYHKWAFDLRENIQHVLLADLNNQSTKINFLTSCEKCPKISLNLLGFYPTLEGDVHLHGYYEIASEEKSQTTRHSFEFNTVMDKSGYQGAVSAMRDSLSALARDIKEKYN